MTLGDHMNSENSAHPPKGLSACGLATMLLGASLAIAKGYDIACDTIALAAEPVEKALPMFPSEAKRGEEGWVQLSFVVSDDGRAVDPVVLASIGGDEFERSAIDALDGWRFEATGEEAGRNVVTMRFERSDDDDRASRNFMRWYVRIIEDFNADKVKAAREALDEVREKGGWTLFEATLLEILDSRIAAAEKDDASRLAALYRALNIGDEAALNVDTLRELYRSIIELETSANRLAAAKASFSALESLNFDEQSLAELARGIEAIENAGASINVDVEIRCDDEPWSHTPTGRLLTFADVEQGVHRYEARCDAKRMAGTVENGLALSLPETWGNCDLLVFGDEGATFSLTESIDYESEESIAGRLE
jgi:TonB family protein